VPVWLHADLVAFSQFIDEMLEVGRFTRIGTEDLLKAFAHSVADRPAGPVIERLNAVVGVRNFHDQFRALMMSIRLRRTKSSGRNLFPAIAGSWLFWLIFDKLFTSPAGTLQNPDWRQSGSLTLYLARQLNSSG
jgi:hypothetical protein